MRVALIVSISASYEAHKGPVCPRILDFTSALIRRRSTRAVRVGGRPLLARRPRSKRQYSGLPRDVSDATKGFVLECHLYRDRTCGIGASHLTKLAADGHDMDRAGRARVFYGSVRSSSTR